MAKNIGFLICLLIMALDVSAGVLGIEAEIAQNKVCMLNVMWGLYMVLASSFRDYFCFSWTGETFEAVDFRV